MRLASFVLSLCLHAGFVLLVLFWPSPPPQKPAAQPIAVSLVDGLPGGSRMPSPILGPQSAPAQKPAPPLPFTPPQEPPPPAVAAPSPQAVPIPVQETSPPKLEAPKPVPKPVPEPDAALLADRKKDEPQKPETPKEDAKPEPKKQEAPKPAAAPRPDPVKAALDKARAAAKPVPGAVQLKPNAVAQALAEARKRSGRGGGGGEGEGEGGGGIGDVWAAQVMLAVQENWHWPAQAGGNLSVALYLKLNAAGRVLDVRVQESSGNAVFDSSAATAVRVTQDLPPPPRPEYREVVLTFYPSR